MPGAPSRPRYRGSVSAPRAFGVDGLGQLEVLVPALSAAIQAGGAVGAAAITASAQKSIAKSQEQADVLKAIQVANAQLEIAKLQAGAGQQVTGGAQVPVPAFNQSLAGQVILGLFVAKLAEVI